MIWTGPSKHLRRCLGKEWGPSVMEKKASSGDCSLVDRGLNYHMYLLSIHSPNCHLLLKSSSSLPHYKLWVYRQTLNMLTKRIINYFSKKKPKKHNLHLKGFLHQVFKSKKNPLHKFIKILGYFLWCIYDFYITH